MAAAAQFCVPFSCAQGGFLMAVLEVLPSTPLGEREHKAEKPWNPTGPEDRNSPAGAWIFRLLPRIPHESVLGRSQREHLPEAPIADAFSPSGRASAPAVERTGQSLRGLHILLADADALLTAVYRRALLRQGAQVAVVANGLDCMDQIARSTPDLLVLEPELPLGGGAGLLAWLYAERRLALTRVIAVTAARDARQLCRILKFPLYDLVVKPLMPGELTEKVVAATQRPPGLGAYAWPSAGYAPVNLLSGSFCGAVALKATNVQERSEHDANSAGRVPGVRTPPANSRRARRTDRHVPPLPLRVLRRESHGGDISAGPTRRFNAGAGGIAARITRVRESLREY
jgi:DNA-binding response OmpR family regulator